MSTLRDKLDFEAARLKDKQDTRSKLIADQKQVVDSQDADIRADAAAAAATDDVDATIRDESPDHYEVADPTPVDGKIRIYGLNMGGRGHYDYLIPTLDTPIGGDAPPTDTPPVDTPPADQPPADVPPADQPPTDSPEVAPDAVPE